MNICEKNGGGRSSEGFLYNVRLSVGLVVGLFAFETFGAASDRIREVPQPAVSATNGVLESAPPGIRIGGDGYLLSKHSESSDESHNCVPPELEQFVNAQVAHNRILLGLTETAPSTPQGGIAAVVPPVLYTFFPCAGRQDHGDVFNGQFVDLDPTPGTQDYQCRTLVGDGHAGVDCSMLSFSQQLIGVPVFAAKDGVVTFAQDGWPDMNLNGGVQGNIIAIDHGNGVESQYYPLRNGSVAVTLGQHVKAGQQIAYAASSGNSFGPHLHFQTMVNGQVYEPFAGACRAGDSGWTNQAALDTNDLFLVDFGITRTDLNTLNPSWWLPYSLPTDSQFSTSDANINFWWEVWNFPTDCPFSVRFYKPNNSLAWDYTWHWGNTELYRHQKSWFGFDFQAMGPVAGTWRIEFYLNGQLMINAPFVVVAGAADPSFNRPPQPITASFLPAAPTTSDVVVCRVNTTLAQEDLDWDVMRYHFVWKVNGNIVRDVTNGVQSDAIPHDLACAGSNLTCTVTPNDGKINGTPASVSTIIPGPITGDLNCDGAVNINDLTAIILNWGTAGPAGDANHDNIVNIDDLTVVILNWTH
ncbi:MAG TPA: peptidoglycan DD-metalloendopeptidase family protein [Phycisphaerales bacterium]|nr:peptidoglycan DD-metalloendopeptidase family protein [Phycisphaerales bacterium]